MKLFWFSGNTPNFGDELNTWLIPKVFPGLLDDNPGKILLAIGSVIFDWHEPVVQKIVFGSGYGGYTPLPDFRDNWKFYCVRGPRTAAACGLSQKYVAGDAALLLRRHWLGTSSPAGKVSFMPHFESLDRGHWADACRQADIHFIDPSDSPTAVMQKIQASRLLISEAMHGAIVADALRVPWLPMLPNDARHHEKWHDWADALGLSFAFTRLPCSSFREGWIRSRGREARMPRPGEFRGLVADVVDPWLTQRAAAGLRRASRENGFLSSEQALEEATCRLEDAAERIRIDYRPR